MIRFWAIIENTIKEGMAKRIIHIIFILTTIIIFFFLLALSATEDAMYLFGEEINELPEQAVREAEAGIIAFFYQFAFMIGVFAVAGFYPTMQDPGTIDLLLSRPMSRFNIFLAKFLGCCLLVLALVSYLVLGSWLVIYFKTGFAYTEYLITIPIFMLIFFAFMSFAALIGILSKNTISAAIMTIFFPYIFSSIFFGLHESAVLSGVSFWGPLMEGLYWIFPKTIELMDWNIQLIRHGDIVAGDLQLSILTTLGFGVVCYAIGSFIFQRRSY
jgi:ABC-type transport system involved in multi-copper enzyme maturation permease subunit